ncbi:hypothetical protein Tdes44962_MAKER08255 [Teratosphaeria destructans]|uniref:Uncharacterized protein n=1 Tax=Teratosphaeria destructans TaxID=418781 RepID=A0A9W7SX90_9PEZI|nr:hypothetical protein Tdes44962_MAKER08255 [Teratosphaeria destructans]
MNDIGGDETMFNNQQLSHRAKETKTSIENTRKPAIENFVATLAACLGLDTRIIEQTTTWQASQLAMAISDAIWRDKGDSSWLPEHLSAFRHRDVESSSTSSDMRLMSGSFGSPSNLLPREAIYRMSPKTMREHLLWIVCGGPEPYVEQSVVDKQESSNGDADDYEFPPGADQDAGEQDVRGSIEAADSAPDDKSLDNTYFDGFEVSGAIQSDS